LHVDVIDSHVTSLDKRRGRVIHSLAGPVLRALSRHMVAM
jgi:hypothetical protein